MELVYRNVEVQINGKEIVKNCKSQKSIVTKKRNTFKNYSQHMLSTKRIASLFCNLLGN